MGEIEDRPDEKEQENVPRKGNQPPRQRGSEIFIKQDWSPAGLNEDVPEFYVTLEEGNRFFQLWI